MTSGL